MELLADWRFHGFERGILSWRLIEVADVPYFVHPPFDWKTTKERRPNKKLFAPEFRDTSDAALAEVDSEEFKITENGPDSRSSGTRAGWSPKWKATASGPGAS